jgi:EpsI family protein
MVWKPAPPPRFAGLDKIAIPMSVAGFQGRVEPVDAVTRTALASAEVTARHYTAPDGMQIDLVMIGGTDRSALHDPRSCLIGAGWQLVDDHVERVPGTGVPVRVCHALTEATAAGASSATEPNYDIEYLYVSGGRVIASATEIRMALLKAALLEQNDTPVYFVRMMTPLPADSATGVREHAELQRFASGLWGKIGSELVAGA